MIKSFLIWTLFKKIASGLCVFAFFFCFNNGFIWHFSVEVECDSSFADTCAQNCARVSGTDTCICSSGYTLASDNTSCDGKFEGHKI